MIFPRIQISSEILSVHIKFVVVFVEFWLTLFREFRRLFS